MPKLRLGEVITEKSIKVTDLSKDIQKAINTLLTQENNLGKIDEKTAENLRLIAQSLNVSISDLFIPAEKFYRLKIFENLNKPEYSGTPKEKLEKLFAKLPSTSKISFSLLSVYATQVLPESLLKGKDLQEISKSLNASLEDLKDSFSAPNETISVNFVLKNLDITLDELSILLEVPKNLIPWISSEIRNPIKINFNKISERSNLDSIHTDELNVSPDSVLESFRLPNICDIFPCPHILCSNCPR